MNATVLYSYEACQDDELSLSVGDVVHVIAQVDSLTYLLYFHAYLLFIGDMSP